MKTTGRILVAMAAVTGGFLAAPLFLPDGFSVTRSIGIDAPAGTAWELIVDLERHAEWHPWDFADPSPRLIFGENRRGEGASYFWIGSYGNHGTLTYRRVDERERRAEASLDLPVLGEARLSFHVAPRGDGADVTEVLRTRSGGHFFRRYLHPVYRAAAARRLEDHLARLKRAAEAAPARPTE